MKLQKNINKGGDKIKIKKQVLAGFLAVVLTLGFAVTTVSAQDDEETTDVNVDIDEVAQVDVRPSALDYTDPALSPGDNREESDGDFEHVEIANIGSVDIEEVTAEATMPTDVPFGEPGDNHDTGNFVTLSTETADQEGYSVGLADGSESTEPHLLNRVEYAEGNPPEYISFEEDEDIEFNDAGDTFEPSETKIGRLRAGSLEYFYVAYVNTDATDNEFNLRIGNAPHTSTQLGSVDFTNDADADEYTEYLGEDDVGDTPGDELDGYYGQITSQDLVVFDPEEGSNRDDYEGESLIEDGTAIPEGDEPRDSLDEDYVREYNLYAHFEDSAGEGHIQRTRFNTQVFQATDDSSDPDRSDETTTGAQTPLVDGTGDDALNPGQNVPINFGVEVPLGTDASDIDSGIVTFVVTQDDE